MFYKYKSRLLALALASLCTNSIGCGGGASGVNTSPNQPSDYNVIFVTMDGLRWQDFFMGTDPMQTPAPHQTLFPNFWGKIAPLGTVYGDPRQHSTMEVTNIANCSLPAYMSIFAETKQHCLTNYCSRTTTPTMLDRMSDELKIPADKLAVLASWSKISLAVTGRDDVATVVAGGGVQASFEAELPDYGKDLDADKGTVPHSLKYIKINQPRFLYISLWDSDRFGHQNDYARYMKVLKAYDAFLNDLVAQLDSMGDYGQKTALIVSTDHGRGVMQDWTNHGPQVPGSDRIWSFVKLPSAGTDLEPVSPTGAHFSHDDLRLTIEALLGLGVRQCSDCGQPLFTKRSDL